jgi:Ser/Thr protein kinase RdoA (MazF antagonist)
VGPAASDPALIPAVLAHYGIVSEAEVRSIESGLINRSYTVRSARGTFVLQWVNPLFDPCVHEDIEAVTAHLEAAGLLTPRLWRTRDGALFVRDARGGIWRLMTHVAGRTLDRLTDPALAASAGDLVGRFHQAVSTLSHDFVFTRLGVHDTARHLARLATALEVRRDHPRHDQVAPLGERILRTAAVLEPLPATPRRVVHGDLKISNLLFAEEAPRALALIDLDTLGRMRLPLEMGDALRSWCNPAGEDDPQSALRPDLFQAALDGYAAATRGLLTSEEISAIVVATQTVAVELAARFCRDALEESYFGWDPRRFSSRSEHNRIRALSQIELADSIAQQRRTLEAVVRKAFGRG